MFGIVETDFLRDSSEWEANSRRGMPGPCILVPMQPELGIFGSGRPLTQGRQGPCGLWNWRRWRISAFVNVSRFSGILKLG